MRIAVVEYLLAVRAGSGDCILVIAEVLVNADPVQRSEVCDLRTLRRKLTLFYFDPHFPAHIANSLCC